MTSGLRRARAAWLVPVISVLLLAAPSATLPGDALGIRRFRTPPLSSSLHLEQTFTMTIDGLSAVEVFPAAEGQVSGDVRFELHALSDRPGDRADILVRSAEVLALDLFKAPSYRFEFPVIPDSKDRTYRLDLVASPATGVALWATAGERYGDGSLYANGRRRWADLAFRVHAPVPSVWLRLMTLRATSPVRIYIVMGAGAAAWVLLGVAVRSLAGRSDESPAA